MIKKETFRLFARLQQQLTHTNETCNVHNRWNRSSHLQTNPSLPGDIRMSGGSASLTWQQDHISQYVWVCFTIKTARIEERNNRDRFRGTNRSWQQLQLRVGRGGKEEGNAALEVLSLRRIGADLLRDETWNNWFIKTFWKIRHSVSESMK